MVVLNALLQAEMIRPIDLALGEFIAGQTTQNNELLGVLAALLSMRLGAQDSCLAIEEIGQPFAELFTFPPVDEIRQILKQSKVVSWNENGEVGEYLPLVFEFDRLYLQRYWCYEHRLASSVLARAKLRNTLDMPVAKSIIESLFSNDSSEDIIDWQKVAVCIAAKHKLSMITGGPGTGKTTTVTKLLALLQGLAKAQHQHVNIQMVAPTGKAAARLSESITSAISSLPESLRQNIPTSCSTIHRLLGVIPNRTQFKYNQNNPLHLDVIVIDEASMVDLPMMSKLFDAIPEDAQIIMLGDKEQLASVEAGSVLSDICAAATQSQVKLKYSKQTVADIQMLCGYQLNTLPDPHQHSIADNLIELQKSHRFSAHSGIGRLAKAIQSGDIHTSLTVLRDNEQQDVSWQLRGKMDELIHTLLPGYRAYFTAVTRGDVKLAGTLLQKQQVLCAQRIGEWGVENINLLVEKELSQQGVISSDMDFYVGRPIMLSENDHNLKLFNGDVGITMPDPVNPELIKVWFADGEGNYRGVLPNRLPRHDTLFAMTIHKSQGSEFEDVYLCLPVVNSSSNVRGLSRELIYTGLTRAKQRFFLYGSHQAVENSIMQQCKRNSGLTIRLTS